MMKSSCCLFRFLITKIRKKFLIIQVRKKKKMEKRYQYGGYLNRGGCELILSMFWKVG